MDFGFPYLTEQIIPYIGNKRKLLTLIYDAMKTTIPEIKPGLKFLDVFSGSGVVSRLAKYLSFEVFSNDWENYSFVINNGLVKTNRKDIISLFGSEENAAGYLKKINDLPLPDMNEMYISKFYAPKSFDIDEADFKSERLFYTRDNALRIDKIRNYIEKEHPDSDDNRIRYFLLSLLIYQAATHTNTSGVFKAFHKGFGGHNRDAMKRILASICLEYPKLIDSDYPIHVYKEDANELVKRNELQNIDIAYLDPPYNQHQYGSNYHILNTIALWDKIIAPLDLNEKGVLKEKAAIRKDWIKTKSDYCYSENALAAFSDLVDNLDAKCILISYSTDGLIPFDAMRNICTRKGKVSIVTNEYTKYRGGKQSNNRLNTNIEFILVVDTQKKSTRQSVANIEKVINRKKIMLLFRQKYSYAKLNDFCENIQDDKIAVKVGRKKVIIELRNGFELFPPEDLDNLTMKEMDDLYNTLCRCACTTKEEELNEILVKINGNPENNLYYIKLIPGILKKLAHKKNKERFYYWLNIIKNLEYSHIELFSVIREKIVQIETLALKRFDN